MSAPGAEKTQHVSDIDAWGTADRHLWLYTLLAIIPFTGFLGLDHFYLRSFNTGMLKAFLNFVTFGLWYFWDVSQMVSSPDREHAQKAGLNAPFELIRGIGRGVFGTGWSASGPSPPKSYLLYTLLSLPMFGVLGLNKLYVGHVSAFFVKIVTLIVFPIAIAWALLDLGRLLFFTDSVLRNGIPGASWAFVPHTSCDTFTLSSICLPKEDEGENIFYKFLDWIGKNIIMRFIPGKADALRGAGHAAETVSKVARAAADAINAAQMQPQPFVGSAEMSQAKSIVATAPPPNNVVATAPPPNNNNNANNPTPPATTPRSTTPANLNPTNANNANNPTNPV
jgi:TM2 domain-containing membrane protein YozV